MDPVFAIKCFQSFIGAASGSAKIMGLGKPDMDFDPIYGAHFTRSLGVLNVALAVANHLPAAAPHAIWVQRSIALIFGGAVHHHVLYHGGAANKLFMPLLLIASATAVPYLTTKGDVTGTGLSLLAAVAGYVISSFWSAPPDAKKAK